MRAANEAALRRRFEQAVEDGDLPDNADPAVLARYVATVSQGISVQASGGATYEQLLPVARLALAAIPDLTMGSS